MMYKKLLETMDYTLAVLIVFLGIAGSLGAFEAGGIRLGQTVVQIGLALLAVYTVWNKGVFRPLFASRHGARPVVPVQTGDRPATGAARLTVVPPSHGPDPSHAA